MRETLLALLVTVLTSSVSLAQTPTPNIPEEESPTVVVGPVDVGVESVPEKEYHVNLIFTHKFKNITFTTKTERDVFNFRESTRLSAGIGWKF